MLVSQVINRLAFWVVVNMVEHIAENVEWAMKYKEVCSRVFPAIVLLATLSSTIYIYSLIISWLNITTHPGPYAGGLGAVTTTFLTKKLYSRSISDILGTSRQ
jgi:hypothetical protein